MISKRLSFLGVFLASAGLLMVIIMTYQEPTEQQTKFPPTKQESIPRDEIHKL